MFIVCPHLFSIFNFTEFDRGDMSEIGKVIIYVMSFKVAQSDTERCGSKLKVIFDDLRSRLTDISLEALVFLSSNSPHLHEIDFDDLAKQYLSWAKNTQYKSVLEKDKYGVVKESKVLTRLMEKTKPSILFKKIDKK